MEICGLRNRVIWKQPVKSCGELTAKHSINIDCPNTCHNVSERARPHPGSENASLDGGITLIGMLVITSYRTGLTLCLLLAVQQDLLGLQALGKRPKPHIAQTVNGSRSLFLKLLLCHVYVVYNRIIAFQVMVVAPKQVYIWVRHLRLQTDFINDLFFAYICTSCQLKFYFPTKNMQNSIWRWRRNFADQFSTSILIRGINENLKITPFHSTKTGTSFKNYST